MKFRLPYLQVGVLFVTLVFLVAAGVPETAVATVESQNSYQLSSELISNPGVISSRESGVEQTASPPAWSLARMEAAQPYPLPAIESFPDTTGNSMQPGSNPVYIPGVPPTNSQTDDASAGSSLLQTGELTNGYDYPAPYTRFENFDSYQQFPYSANGVLFFSRRGSDYRCSAAVVGENALWTAGHCVHDGSDEPEGWSEDVVFVPAYENGNAPYGSWSYFDLVTRVAWYSAGDLRFDIGGVILHPNFAEQSVRDMVGGLGFAYNLNPIQHWFNIGYPSQSPFDGKTMQICAGSFARNATITSAPIPVGMGCDMTKGSSGGAWIVNFGGSAASMNYLNGNNSFRYTNKNEEIYSPYFGDAAKDLLFYIATEAEVLLPIITHSGDQ